MINHSSLDCPCHIALKAMFYLGHIEVVGDLLTVHTQQMRYKYVLSPCTVKIGENHQTSTLADTLFIFFSKFHKYFYRRHSPQLHPQNFKTDLLYKVRSLKRFVYNNLSISLLFVMYCCFCFCCCIDRENREGMKMMANLSWAGVVTIETEVQSHRTDDLLLVSWDFHFRQTVYEKVSQVMVLISYLDWWQLHWPHLCTALEKVCVDRVMKFLLYKENEK